MLIVGLTRDPSWWTEFSVCNGCRGGAILQSVNPSVDCVRVATAQAQRYVSTKATIIPRSTESSWEKTVGVPTHARGTTPRARGLTLQSGSTCRLWRTTYGQTDRNSRRKSFRSSGDRTPDPSCDGPSRSHCTSVGLDLWQRSEKEYRRAGTSRPHQT